MIQQQDRDDTVLLLATQEQQNIHLKITSLEHNVYDSDQQSISDTSTRQ